MIQILDSPSVTAVIGSCAGAAIAFLFIRLNTRLDQKHEHRKRHYNQLVALSHCLNSMLDDANVLADGLRHLAKIYESVQPPRLAITFSLPQQLTFDDSHLVNLANIDLVNDLYTHGRKVRRINTDVSTIRQAYEVMLDRTLGGHIPPDAYTGICRQNAPICHQLASFADGLVNDTITVCAIVRVRMKRDKPRMFSSKILGLPSRYEKSFRGEVERERLVLEQEIVKISKDAQADIDRMMAGGAGGR